MKDLFSISPQGHAVHIDYIIITHCIKKERLQKDAIRLDSVYVQKDYFTSRRKRVVGSLEKGKRKTVNVLSSHRVRFRRENVVSTVSDLGEQLKTLTPRQLVLAREDFKTLRLNSDVLAKNSGERVVELTYLVTDYFSSHRAWHNSTKD